MYETTEKRESEDRKNLAPGMIQPSWLQGILPTAVLEQVLN